MNVTIHHYGNHNPVESSVFIKRWNKQWQTGRLGPNNRYPMLIKEFRDEDIGSYRGVFAAQGLNGVYNGALQYILIRPRNWDDLGRRIEDLAYGDVIDAEGKQPSESVWQSAPGIGDYAFPFLWRILRLLNLLSTASAKRS